MEKSELGYSTLTNGNDPQLYWKLDESKEINYCIIEFSDPPPQSIGQVFWSNFPDYELSEERSKVFNINPGKTKYIISIGSNNKISSVRFDPGHESNLYYNIKSIEYFYK